LLLVEIVLNGLSIGCFFAIDASTSRITSSLSIEPDPLVGIGLERGSLCSHFLMMTAIFDVFYALNHREYPEYQGVRQFNSLS
jgi:hypothetical protein